MSTVSQSTGTLTTADISTLVTLARIQGDIGTNPLTKASLTDFMAQLNTLSFTDYGATTNAQVKGWADLLYAALIATQTNYQQTVTALYAAYNYGIYYQASEEPSQWYGWAFKHFLGVDYPQSGFPPWTPPSQSPTWSTTLTTLLNQWRVDPDHPTASVIDVYGDPQQQIDFQAKLLDPANWTNAAQVQVNARPLWDAQSAALRALVTQGSLAENDALLVLFLLIAMVNSLDAPSRSLGYQIANLDTNSVENPNDTLIDQLVYYSLMEWIDPKGSYQWTHDQLASTLAALAAAVPNQDPGSVVLQKTFGQQAAVLKSSPSYPMIDPYNPSIGFPQRKTDTLAALNQAWANFVSG